MKKPHQLDEASFTKNNISFSSQNKDTLFAEKAIPLVSYFKTITDRTPQEITIFKVLEFVKSGTFKNEITILRKTTDKTERDNIKKRLPSITVSGTFKDGHAKKNLIKHSGLIQIDFDNVPEPEQLKKTLCNDAFTFCSFISPSGTGVKVIVKIHIDRHNESFTELSKYYLEKYRFPIDEKCKDVSRLMFLSSDSTLFLNENSMQFNNTLTDTENIITQIEANKIDITSDYDNWLKIGFAFADEFKEAGRELFHRVSRFYPKYDKANTDTQFNECLKPRKNGTTIKTFFGIAKGSGLNINNKNINIVAKPEIKKQPQKHTTNSFLIVEKYLAERYDFRYNEVTDETEHKGKNENKYSPLNENNIYRELQHNNIGFSPSKLQVLFRSDYVNPYNPIIEYFENLPEWDGETDYINKLCGYITAKDQDRFRRHFKKALVRCIACSLGRTFNKQAFILIGGQSSGKSTFIRWLCPPALKEYITENISTDKDSQISLCENFIINLDELAGLQRVELTALKSMISKDVVKVRRPYDKKQRRNIRRANFFGSTNKDEFLTDETGSVRWLCFEILKINYAYKLEIDINLVWAQAYNLFKEGFEYELTTPEINENESANAVYQQITIEKELIQKYFEPAKKGDEKAEAMTATEILEKLHTHTISVNNSTIQKVGKALTELGYAKVSERIGDEKNPRKVYWVKFKG